MNGRKKKKKTINDWNIEIWAGELRVLYRASGVAVIGGSFLPGLCGHNVSEAAAAACSILTGMN